MKIEEIKKCEKELERLGFENNQDFPALWALRINENSSICALLYHEYYGILLISSSHDENKPDTLDNNSDNCHKNDKYGNREFVMCETFNTYNELCQVFESMTFN